MQVEKVKSQSHMVKLELHMIINIIKKIMQVMIENDKKVGQNAQLAKATLIKVFTSTIQSIPSDVKSADTKQEII